MADTRTAESVTPPTYDMEKTDDNQHIEKASSSDIDNELTEENDPRITRFTHAEQRKIIHKVDRRLVITVGALYCISLMDRTNLSAANIAGYVSLPSFHSRPRLIVVSACVKISSSR
jgi:hypothetical protein